MTDVAVPEEKPFGPGPATASLALACCLNKMPAGAAPPTAVDD